MKAILLSCLILVLFAQESLALSKKGKEAVLNAHNNYRSAVAPPASNMLKMQWSEKLGKVAQTFAEKCIWDHNAKRSEQGASEQYSYVGENIYVTSGQDTTVNLLEAAVDFWHSEVSSYSFSSNNCSGTCGHYKQLVWNDSKWIGCGVAKCPTIEGIPGWRNVVLIVCNYGPGGNYPGQKPYTSGEPCSQCPTGTTCRNKLCAK